MSYVQFAQMKDHCTPLAFRARSVGTIAAHFQLLVQLFHLHSSVRTQSCDLEAKIPALNDLFCFKLNSILMDKSLSVPGRESRPDALGNRGGLPSRRIGIQWGTARGSQVGVEGDFLLQMESAFWFPNSGIVWTHSTKEKQHCHKCLHLEAGRLGKVAKRHSRMRMDSELICTYLDLVSERILE